MSEFRHIVKTQYKEHVSQNNTHGFFVRLSQTQLFSSNTSIHRDQHKLIKQEESYEGYVRMYNIKQNTNWLCRRDDLSCLSDPLDGYDTKLTVINFSKTEIKSIKIISGEVDNILLNNLLKVNVSK